MVAVSAIAFTLFIFLSFYSFLYILFRESGVRFFYKLVLASILAYIFYLLGITEVTAYIATGITLVLFYHIPPK